MWLYFTFGFTIKEKYKHFNAQPTQCYTIGHPPERLSAKVESEQWQQYALSSDLYPIWKGTIYWKPICVPIHHLCLV